MNFRDTDRRPYSWDTLYNVRTETRSRLVRSHANQMRLRFAKPNEPSREDPPGNHWLPLSFLMEEFNLESNSNNAIPTQPAVPPESVQPEIQLQHPIGPTPTRRPSRTRIPPRRLKDFVLH
ncbi:hypothetical protein ABEB36_009606 [Hypothenemus hampei]|uniref:Uncharacterized protein n=1 Tax=Hypothenemus hampei TaxID=57062 RepID=A0ABD1EGV4_HYPHA